MSGIREAENALFDEWESLSPDGGYFNRDGVVDPGQWESERGQQILFLMKDTDGLREDLRDFLCRGGRGQTWNTVVRWAGALSGGSTAVPDFERRRDILRHLCVVNLKKYAGGPRVSDDAVRQAAETDRTYLRLQLQLYRPTLALACGKSSVFSSVWALEEAGPEILHDRESGLRFYHSALLHCPVVEIRHPNRANVAEWCRRLEKFRVLVL